MEEKERLVTSLQLIDPLLQFLTKATGKTLIPLNSLRSIIPKDKQNVIKDVPHLCNKGVLYIEGHINGDDSLLNAFNDINGDDSLLNAFNDNNDGGESTRNIMVGFPKIMNHFASGDSGNDNVTNVAAVDNKNHQIKGGLHGSTKAAGKRRLAALNRSFKREKNTKATKSCTCTSVSSNNQNYGHQLSSSLGHIKENANDSTVEPPTLSRGLDRNMLNGMVHHDTYAEYSVKRQHDRIKEGHDEGQDENGLSNEAKVALDSLHNLFDKNIDQDSTTKSSTSTHDNTLKPTTNENSFILPRQAAYAGSQIERPLRKKFLSSEKAKMIPKVLAEAMGIQLVEESNCRLSSSDVRHKLYLHQANAIESALDSIHTLVCTGTGSGKSLCFLLPILATVMNNDIHSTPINSTDSQSLQNDGTTALIMFPTKALAQDQLSKLESLLKKNPLLQRHIRCGIIDGDVPHQNRQAIADKCNIILSNPDTLHAAILPGWKTNYQNLLAKLQYIVIDELHSYEGAFGAHVSLVLSRLYRLSRVANLAVNNECKRKLVFLGCSATIGHPEDHFRLICPIATQEKVTVITAQDDGSKCAAKHFFVWNPPLLDSNGNSIGRVTVPPRNDANQISQLSSNQRKKRRKGGRLGQVEDVILSKTSISENIGNMTVPATGDIIGLIKRNHAADETARVLAHLVKHRIRSIAFCKTRCLAEWVYERCISILRSTSEGMASMVEIYRGGYSATIRRGIEGRLFRNELFGVVGTCALELGVDIGGIDVTLHCGYPGSISSVLQQAGRAGRGLNSNGPSHSIMVCFSSPSEQVRIMHQCDYYFFPSFFFLLIDAVLLQSICGNIRKDY